MTTREKRLATAVAVTAAVWVGNRGWQSFRDARTERQASAETAAEELADAEFAVARGEKAHAQLESWRRQSLPADRRVAKSQYQDWLRQKLSDAGLEVSQITDRSAARERRSFEVIGLDAHCQGTVGQLAKFLHSFASAELLHRVAAASVGKGTGDKLSISLTVEAAALPQAQRRDLAETPTRTLAETADQVAERVSARAIFDPFKPPSAPAEDASPAVTGMTYGAGGWSVEVKTAQPAGVRRYRAGDKVEAGKFAGTLVEADGRRAIFQTEAGRIRVALGQKLSEGEPIEDKAG